MPRDIFILGCGRSGTSLVAGLFRSAGYFQGSKFYRSRPSNPLGFFEDVETNNINEVLLEPLTPEATSHGHRWLARIPTDSTITATPDTGRRIRDVLENRPFCLKDPRFCYTLHLWRQHAPLTRMICVFRNPRIVVASIMSEIASAPYLRNLRFTTVDAFAVWRQMYLHVLERHAVTGDWLFIEYGDLFNTAALERITEFSGAQIDRTFPDRALDRSSPISVDDMMNNKIYEKLISYSKATLWR